MAQTVTLSSVGTATIVLNPVAKSTTVMLTATSQGSSNATLVQIDMSLDDPSTTPAPTMTWALLSSGAAMSSSGIFGTGFVYTVLSPIGAVRVNSSLMAASSATFVLKALQSVTA
jgi:hypothetical protein